MEVLKLRTEKVMAEVIDIRAEAIDGGDEFNLFLNGNVFKLSSDTLEDLRFSIMTAFQENDYMRLQDAMSESEGNINECGLPF